jgi:hypothetical protein
MILKTTTGTIWDTEKRAWSNLILHIDSKGNAQISTLKIIGLGRTHTEWKELHTDVVVEDQFGDRHEICEELLNQ